MQINIKIGTHIGYLQYVQKLLFYINIYFDIDNMIYISFDIGVKNLALCILKQCDNKLSIIDWQVICLAEKKKQLKGVNSIAEVLFYEMDNIIGRLEGIGITYIDKVVIENQPSNLNGIMKTIQYLIFSYFDLLRHWDKLVGEVVLINPTHKLQNHCYAAVTSDQVVSTDKRKAKNDKYKQNKLHGIQICSQYIKNDAVLQELFNAHKKKDDLADTCLQTVSYIRKGGADIQEVSLDADNLLLD